MDNKDFKQIKIPLHIDFAKQFILNENCYRNCVNCPLDPMNLIKSNGYYCRMKMFKEFLDIFYKYSWLSEYSEVNNA